MSAPRRAHAVDGKLPRPELPDTANRFWALAWHFRKLTERDALVRCRRAEYSRKREIEGLTYALTSAICDLDDEIKRSDERILREGLLPFAWAGTTVFATEAVPA